MINGKRPWILCVDDDQNVLLVRKLLLEKDGCAVLTATDAESALRVLKAVRVDLVVTDHFLQGRSGTDLAAAIKAVFPDIPVILQSGAVEIFEGLEHVDVLLSKAEHPSVLLWTITRLLNQPNSGAETTTA